jgi:hypothetical protein
MNDPLRFEYLGFYISERVLVILLALCGLFISSAATKMLHVSYTGLLKVVTA